MITEHFDNLYAFGVGLVTLPVREHEHAREAATVTVQTAETDSEYADMRLAWDREACYQYGGRVADTMLQGY